MDRFESVRKTPDNLKVAILIPCLNRGGTELQTITLSTILISYGFVVEVICYFEYDELVVLDFKDIGVKIRLLTLDRESGFIRLINKIRREAKMGDPDIVNVQYLAPGALPIIASRLAGVKTVFATVHQPYTKSLGKLAKLFLSVSSLLTTKFIVVSQNAEKSWFGTSCLFDESKPLKLQPRHFTIHNAIDISRIRRIVSGVNITELKSKLAIPDDTPIIGAISRLRYEKGIDILLEAFNLLILSGEKVHLLLVGAGPDEEKLKDSVHAYGLNSFVTFNGEAEWERAMQLMSLMDIVVVPSRFEGFGLTAAEAMAMGKPVVASDTSGLKEVVRDGETGVLFPVDDVTALKRAIEVLIKDPQMRKRLGAAGKERVLANFSLDLYSIKIKALYNL